MTRLGLVHLRLDIVLGCVQVNKAGPVIELVLRNQQR